TTPALATFTSISITSSITAKNVWAAPSGSAGTPTWRQLSTSDISGIGSIATQSASSVAITGGAIDGTTIGGTTPAAGSFTTLAVTGSLTASFVLAAPTGSAGAPAWRRLSNSDISGLGSLATQSNSSVSITGGAIDGTSVGTSTASTGRFTTLTLTTSQAAATVLAAPNGSAGAPSFRTLSTADLSGLGSLATQAAS